jgi:predicted Rossmann fold nucleotide-binding protein DprA/Smf involved in DNA uptake
MSRNKYIYAMADYALIVSAELQKGGTWAGAVEELRRDKARPLFVCDEPNGPEGNRALIQLGALPFPSQPWKEGLVLLLKARRKHFNSWPVKQVSLFEEPLYLDTSTPASVKENVSQYSADQLQEIGPGPDIEVAGQLTPTSIYEAILPVLLDALNDWKSPKEVAASLEIRKNQLDAWLRRATGEGRIEKKIRPIRYRRVET